MDETGQPPQNTPAYGAPAYGTPACPQQPAGYSPQQPPGYAPPPMYVPYQPPAAPSERKRSKGWLIALVIVGVFFVGTIVMCAWLASFSTTEDFGATSDAVALIHIDGVIAGTGTSAVTPEEILYQLDQAEKDDYVKAILLRIDSPGGTVAASEEIAREVARAGKPVVASIGDSGASGAYMVASQCDAIVAAPGSAVGSIGVILQVANLQQLLDKLGVKFAVITAGKYKDIGSPYRSLTTTETKLLKEQVDIDYEHFIELVAEGRKMTKDEVRELATGFAWAGSQAKTLGLVDEIGNYNDAVDRAAKLGKIDGEPEIVEFGQDDYLGALSSLVGLASKLDRIGAALEMNPASTGTPLSR